MDNKEINSYLSQGIIDNPALFPNLTKLKSAPFLFKIDFGLEELPTEPGILLIRGARQYGKSTWLEQQILKTIQQFGPGTAYYLNGENLLTIDALEAAIETLLPVFAKHAKVQRIFIDEITAIQNWEIVLKRMADRGKLTDVLIVTTGSKATDLRRGAEKLPGRKGKLARTSYLFTPISYKEFHRVCSDALGENSLIAYLLSGGSPVACTELAANGLIPEYVITLVRDWIDGEIARSGRARSALFNVFSVLFRLGGNAVGQAKLAREAGLANNTVAQAYIEILNDLGCVVPGFPWDQHRQLLILRKPCKYHFTNLLAAVTYNKANLRSPDDFLALPEQTQGMWYEWLIAQELLRRAAIRGEEILAPLAFWQNKNHEIDFVVSENEFLEVKRGTTSVMEFSWFAKQFPGKHLTVLTPSSFETNQISSASIEAFLLNDESSN